MGRAKEKAQACLTNCKSLTDSGGGLLKIKERAFWASFRQSFVSIHLLQACHVQGIDRGIAEDK